MKVFERCKISQEVDACKFAKVVYNGKLSCKQGYRASVKCFTKGRSECAGYRRLIVLTAKEMQQKIEKEGQH